MRNKYNEKHFVKPLHCKLITVGYKNLHILLYLSNVSLLFKCEYLNVLCICGTRYTI